MGYADGKALIGWATSTDRTSTRALTTQQIKSFSKFSASFGTYNPYSAKPIAGVPTSNLFGASPSKPGYPKVGAPQKLEFSMPWSGGEDKIIAARPSSTQGDFFASLGASFDNAIGQGGYLNLANAIPWGMERTGVLAREAAGMLTSDDDNIVAQGLDFIGSGIKAVSDILAPVIEWFPNTVRDTMLNQRTMVYKALVKGESLGPLEYLGSQLLSQIGLNDASLTGKGMIAGRLNPVQRQVLAAAIDLPTAVKRGLSTDPNADIESLFKATPEGRQFTYMGGLGGGLVNALSYLTLYGVEMFATGGLAGAASAAGAASTIPLVAGGTRVAAGAVKGIHQVQKVFLASGLGYFGAATMLDAVARTVGNQEAVAWFDRMNRSTIISDSPSVQLVTSFSVNPFGAAKMAKTGVVKLAHGGEIVFDKVTANRFSRLYTQRDAVRKVIGEAYRTTRPDDIIGPEGAYDSWGQATDRVVEWAADDLADRGIIPKDDIVRFHALPDGRTRTTAVLQKYADQIVDTIKNTPKLVADRLQRDWEYHGFAGPWDRRIAILTERDYAAAKTATEQLRQQNDLVVGYVDLLAPEGQAAARQIVDDLFAKRPATLSDLNDLTRRFPALKGLYRDLVPGRAIDEVVSRNVFDTVLQRAAEKYADTVRRNPVKAATGVDPVLRPSSRNPQAEMAVALGTTEDTVRAIGKNPTAWTAEEDDLVRAFAREKQIIPDVELAAMQPAPLWERVSAWVDDTTEPWLKRGAEVERIEAEFVRVTDRIRELDDLVRSGRGDLRPELRKLEADRGKLYGLLADVREPDVPFSQSVKFAIQDSAAVERARTIVAARERLSTIDYVLSRVGEVQKHAMGDVLRSVDNVNGEWRWVSDLRTTSGPVFDAAVQAYRAWRYKWAPTLTGQGRKGTFKKRGMTRAEQSFIEAPAEYKAAEMVDSPGFVKFLARGPDEEAFAGAGVTKGEIAELMRANRQATSRGAAVEITDEMIAALGVDSREAFVAELGRLRQAYDDALNGSRVAEVRRVAGREAPEWAISRVREGESPDIWFDAEAQQGRESARQQLSRALESDESFPAVAGIVRSDPYLTIEAEALAGTMGRSVDDLLADPANAEALRQLVGALPEEPIVPGVPRALTEVDQAILSGDKAAIEGLKPFLDDLRGRLAPPKRNVPIEDAAAMSRIPRPSRQIAGDMADSGVGWHEVVPEAAWAKYDVGSKVLSVILHGNTSFPPRTPKAILTALKEIENGNAANLGIGTDLLAEAQRAAKGVLGRMVGEARRAQVEAGVLGMGKGLNPYTLTQDSWDMIDDLLGKAEGKAGIIVRDDQLGLQYGLKQRPKDALVLEMSSVPGLAEELLTGHFRPWNERMGVAQVRQAFNAIFGPRHNQMIAYEARGRFMDALAARGVPAQVSSRIWSAWKKAAEQSREARVVRRQGRITTELTGNARYASERNIPNAELQRIAQEEVRGYFGAGSAIEETIDFAEEFRLASSFTRRQLAKLPLGDALQRTYGAVVHNKFTTTMYYIFRFGLDVRFHALNALEGPMLFAGRSGMRPKDRLVMADEGLMGYTKDWLGRMASDGLNDTGYPFSQSRAAWAYRTFLREQPEKLRGLMAEDPKLMQEAVERIMQYDPELSATIRAMGDTPDSYLRVMDQHYRKMLASVDTDLTIREGFAKEAFADPLLAEVYGRLEKVNAQLWQDVRATFFGNPSRSIAERTLNHYLLYWPISYQIKATKWLLRVMFDRAGGMPTNAAGAYAMDQLQGAHEELLVNDPEYAQFFDEHPSLLFAAQMLFPMTPGSIGVSLSPLTRAVFFDRSRNILEIGPVYTVTKFLPSIAGELYADFGQVPGVDILARAVGIDTPDEP